MRVKFIKSILWLLLWSTKVTTESLNNTHTGLKGFLLEGDMVLTEEQKNWRRNPMLTARNGVQDPRYRWPNGVLLYRISSAFSATEVKIIHDAMNGIASGSCIRFKEAPNNAQAYVNIYIDKETCFSDLGYTNDVKRIGLTRDCVTYGILQHELMHALAFDHQHNDPNRDKYIKVNYENIKKGEEGNFEKMQVANDFGVGYDYDSVMHYASEMFSSNGKPTMESKTPGVKFGLLTGMSKKDFLKLNRMYKCPFKNQ